MATLTEAAGQVPKGETIPTRPANPKQTLVWACQAVIEPPPASGASAHDQGKA